MVSLFDDQAAGLRKLFAGARGPATVAFAGPCGIRGARNAMVASLARGLASAGKEVLVIDEHIGVGSVAAAFGLRSRYDLLQALNRDVPANKVLLQAETSIRLLPAARAARHYPKLDAMERRALGEWLRRLQKGVDFVLVDTADRSAADFSPLLPQPQRIIIAVSPDARSITEAYAQMKRLAHQRDCRCFGIVIMRPAGSTLGVRAADPAEGKAVFVNLREVARRHLGAELELIGSLTADGDSGGIGQHLVESLLNPSGEAEANGNRFPAPGRGMLDAPQSPKGTPSGAGGFLRGAPQEYFLEQGKPGSRGAPQEYFLEQGKPGSRGVSIA